uniref:Uncharacterized protein n=1 Tax=Oryzias melastigma TaxID=30732 RepID=A0A3B3C0M2_ORYME
MKTSLKPDGSDPIPRSGPEGSVCVYTQSTAGKAQNCFLWGQTPTEMHEHVPVENVVVGEALSVEKVPEELPQVRVVGFIVEPQRAAEVQVCGKLGFRGKKTEVRIRKKSLAKSCSYKREVAVNVQNKDSSCFSDFMTAHFLLY